MSALINRVQFQVKKTGSHLGVYFARVLTGSWIGLIFAHLFQQIFAFENFLFLFVILLFTAVIVRISRNWGILSVVIFNLFCVLVVVLMQMYIKVAPGA
jgi:hypothetical protein